MKLHALIFIGISIAGIYSCKKNPDTEKLSAAFVVVTSRAKEANFSSYSTYFISDTIAKISNDAGNRDTIITGPAAQQIVGEIKAQMDARGFTFLPRPGRPNMELRSLVIKQVNTGVVYPPGWWWGYPGYPGGCWWYGCYPPYYPIYPTVYQYTVGDYIVETFDIKNAEGNNNMQNIWYIQLSGVLSDTDVTNVNRTIEGVKQAFVQSPYVKK